MDKKMLSIGKIKIKAIVYGFLVNEIGSTLIGGVMGIIYGVVNHHQGVPMKSIHAVEQDVSLLIISLVAGLIFTFIGGYVAGRIAKESEVLHGGVIGALDIILGIFLGSSLPIWFNIISFLGVIPAGIAGGYLAKKKKLIS